MLLSEKITLARLLQIRPSAIGLLNAGGISFWEDLQMPVELFCKEGEMNLESWLEQVNNLPVLPDNSDCVLEPLYRVADFLTAEHRLFRKTLDRIGRRLHSHNLKETSENAWIRQVGKVFGPFRILFLEHMREEEENFFPHILRLEALICDVSSRPLPGQMALEKNMSKQINLAEASLKKTLGLVQEKTRSIRMQDSTANLAHKIRAELETFERRLHRHNELPPV